jgi:extracellular factor (EF) 3-hydroxypalmitic acid methyl ester biosynthesis protein
VLSLAVVRANHGDTISTHEANVIHFLRGAAKRGETFDLIYTLGLTDYFDDRAMSLLHRLMKACLAPGGEIMVANFVPDHLAVGWMDAVMDWHLIYRTEADMERFATEIGMQARTFRDVTGSIVFCEMVI